MICKGCGKDKKLVKSHIIPAAFFRDLTDGEDDLNLVSGDQIGIAKRSRTGIYDKSILCKDCEDKSKCLIHTPLRHESKEGTWSLSQTVSRQQVTPSTALTAIC
jgi:hypothetical protein